MMTVVRTVALDLFSVYVPLSNQQAVLEPPELLSKKNYFIYICLPKQ